MVVVMWMMMRVVVETQISYSLLAEKNRAVDVQALVSWPEDVELTCGPSQHGGIGGGKLDFLTQGCKCLSKLEIKTAKKKNKPNLHQPTLKW